MKVSAQEESSGIADKDYTTFRSEQKTFQSSDGIIKYIDQGEGKAILLLHGIPSSSWLYRKMITGLVDGGYRVIAPDMLGFGSSDNPEGYDLYAPDQHAKRILELMDFLAVNNWSHVMHDAGGLWTWELVEQAPNRINHLVILNTIIYEEGFKPPIKMKRGMFSAFSMWLYRNGVTTNLMLMGLFKKGLMQNKLTKKDLEGYRTPLREGKTKGMYHFFSKTCNNFPEHDSTIAQFNAPKTVIWGKHDDMLQWEPQKERVIDHAHVDPDEIHILDGKHFIQEEFPETINAIILNALSSE